MTRYEKVKKILDSLPEKERRICYVEGCACIGCATSKGVRDHELKLYLAGKLK